MKPMIRRGLALTILAVVLSVGCRNPFNPSADIHVIYIPEIEIYQAQVSVTPVNYNSWISTIQFIIENKVAVYLREVNVIYTDYAGNAVTKYGVAGRTFAFYMRLDPVENAGQVVWAGGFYAVGNMSTVVLYIVDSAVLSELTSPSYPSDKVMFANMTFRGEDDNGYDVKVSGRITIRGYGIQ